MFKRVMALVLAMIVFGFCLPAGAEGYPLTVTDAIGRQVTISACPERVVSGYYITTSMLIALGLQEKLVGIEAKAASREIYRLAAPELIRLPSVGSAKQLDLEGIIALKPDLVILPMKQQKSAETLAEIGIPVLVVNPEDNESLNDTLSLLGLVLNADPGVLFTDREEKTALLAKTLEDCVRPRVYLAGNSEMLKTAGRNMYQHTMLTLGGGENVAAEIEDGYWTEISYEQLLAWNPEVIVIAADASYTPKDVYSDEMLQHVKAVETKRVYALPSVPEAWDSPVPGSILGSLWLASRLFPDRYSPEDFMSDAVSFYQRFYHFDAEKVLSR